MARMFASDPHAIGVDTDRRRYNNDRAGFVHVEDNRDIKALKAGGYVVAGQTPKTNRSFVCACGFVALINHCPRCDRDDLERVES